MHTPMTAAAHRSRRSRLQHLSWWQRRPGARVNSYLYSPYRYEKRWVEEPLVLLLLTVGAAVCVVGSSFHNPKQLGVCVAAAAAVGVAECTQLYGVT